MKRINSSRIKSWRVDETHHGGKITTKVVIAYNDQEALDIIKIKSSNELKQLPASKRAPDSTPYSY